MLHVLDAHCLVPMATSCTTHPLQPDTLLLIPGTLPCLLQQPQARPGDNTKTFPLPPAAGMTSSSMCNFLLRIPPHTQSLPFTSHTARPLKTSSASQPISLCSYCRPFLHQQHNIALPSAKLPPALSFLTAAAAAAALAASASATLDPRQAGRRFTNQQHQQRRVQSLSLPQPLAVAPLPPSLLWLPERTAHRIVLLPPCAPLPAVVPMLPGALSHVKGQHRCFVCASVCCGVCVTVNMPQAGLAYSMHCHQHTYQLSRPTTHCCHGTPCWLRRLAAADDVAGCQPAAVLMLHNILAVWHALSFLVIWQLMSLL